jgi:sugar-specific transcriptional regulator TrmB
LKAVGLVQASTTKPRCYEALDPAAFIAGVKALLESAPALELAATADAPVGRKKLTLKSKPKKA